MQKSAKIIKKSNLQIRKIYTHTKKLKSYEYTLTEIIFLWTSVEVFGKIGKIEKIIISISK